MTAKDDDGGIGTDSVNLTFQNVAPMVAWLPPGQLDEGGVVTLQVWTKDNPHDDEVLRIDWGDGSDPVVIEDAPITGFPTVDYTPDPLLFQHKYLDDNPTATPWDNYPISVTLKDDDGGYSGDYASSLRVDNVPPTADLVSNGPVAPGEEVAVGFINITDPGVNDTFKFGIDWNNDGDFNDQDEAFGSQPYATHTFMEEGNYLVQGLIEDDDGGQKWVSTVVQVMPDPPRIQSIKYMMDGTTGDLSEDNPTGQDANGQPDGTPNFGGGWRFFPDAATYQTRNVSRNIVRIRAVLNQAKADVPVYFRSFDVDDYSDINYPVDQREKLDPNDAVFSTGGDNRGTVIGDKLDTPGESIELAVYRTDGYRGRLRPIGGAFAQEGGVVEVLTKLVDGQAVAEVDLATSFAPGDNFRVVADTNRLDITNLNDTTDVQTVGPIANFRGKITPQLAIWRHFHIEQDRMASLNPMIASGTITGVGPRAPNNDLTVWVGTTLGLTQNSFQGGLLTDSNGNRYHILSHTTYPSLIELEVPRNVDLPVTGSVLVTQGDWQQGEVTSSVVIGNGLVTVSTNISTLALNEYEGGTLRINNIAYPVLGNTEGPGANFLIASLAGIPTGTFQVFQDDFTPDGTLRVNLNDDSHLYDYLQSTTKRSQNRFADAFMEPELHALDMFDSNDVTPTYHISNLMNEVISISSGFRGTSPGAPPREADYETNVFWSVYVSTGFECHRHLDGDPGNERMVLGLTQSDSSFVFLEPLRDGNPNDPQADGVVRAQVTVHEIGHQFHVAHGPLEEVRNEHREDPINIMASTVPQPDLLFYFYVSDVAYLRSLRTSTSN